MKALYIGTVYRVNGRDAVYTGLTYPIYNFRDKNGEQLSVTAEDLYLDEPDTPEVPSKGKKVKANE